MFGRLFGRSSSNSDQEGAPPGYGSIPTTEDYNDDDHLHLDLNNTTTMSNDVYDDLDDNPDNWLNLNFNNTHDNDTTPTAAGTNTNMNLQTPSPYAAAGYQRLRTPSSPIAVTNATLTPSAATSNATGNGNLHGFFAALGSPFSPAFGAETPQAAADKKQHHGNIAAFSTVSPHQHKKATPSLVLEELQELARDLGETARQILQDSDEDNVGNISSESAAATPRHVGKASIASEIATMTKSIVGCGVLSLPGGIAMFSNSDLHPTKSLFWAMVWILLMGAIFGFFCLLLGKLCSMTKQTTYKACWQVSMAKISGPERQGQQQSSITATGAMIVSLANATKAGLADLAYSTILSQTFWSLFQTMGLTSITRIQSLWIVTLVGILPLCLLQNLHVLAPFSVLGTLGILFTASCMVIRLFDGSYQPGGAYYDDLAIRLQPAFAATAGSASDGAIQVTQPSSVVSTILHMLPFVCMLFEGFVMHYNSPRFYAELENASIPRFTMVVVGAFGLSTIIFMVIAGAGFLTFGGHADGYILNNYSHRDPLATMSRLAIAIAILLTYPLAFIGMRDGVMHSFFGNTSVHSDHAHGQGGTANVNVLTLILLGCITLMACVVSDLALINAVGGGTLAMAIVFVFPAIMYQAAIRQQGMNATLQERREVVLALALMVFGVAIGLTGAYLALGHAR